MSAPKSARVATAASKHLRSAGSDSAGNGEMVGQLDADPHAAEVTGQRAHVVVDRAFGARLVTRVVSGDDLEHGRAITGRPGQGTDVIEAVPQRDATGFGDPTEGRHQPGHPVPGGGDPDAAAGIGADPGQDQTGGDPVPRPRARSSGRAVEVPRVPRDGEGLGRVGRPDGEFRRGELARDDRPGRLEAGHHRAVLSGAPCPIEDQAVPRCRALGHGQDVLHPDGDALVRPLVDAVGEVLVGLFGLGHGVVVEPGHIGARHRIEGVGPGDHGGGDGDARGLACPQAVAASVTVRGRSVRCRLSMAMSFPLW